MSPEQVVQKSRPAAPKRPVTLATRIEKAKTVAVSGDFNDWAPVGIPMEKSGQGEWCLTFKLPPGEYQYRLLVDGRWHDHPEAKKRVPNPFGSDNCVLSIG
jgi:1,4-alpha-glucan branching enzyme